MDTSGNATTQQPSIFGAKSAPSSGAGLFGAPASTGGTSGGLFGSSTSATGGSIFGGGLTNTPATGPTTTPAAPSTSIFGAGSSTSATAPTGFFGAATAATTPAAGTAAPAASSSNALFGSSSFLKAPEQTATSSPKPSTSSLFGQPSTSTGTTTTPGGLFGQPSKTADSNKPAGAASPAASTTALGGGLFGKPATSTPATAASASTSGTAPTAPTLSLFGTKPEEKKDGSVTGSSKPTEPATAPGTKPISTTPNVVVAPPSMLKGKTIEEIVNGWSADLETHVREFNKLATEVAVWDRALIENGNNLSALYSHVLAAEREQHDIGQSLDHVEQQQKELSDTLDAYEKVTQEILGGASGGLRALDTGPADTERDKNYMLATDLHTQLDDLSASLAQMIDSVNALSLPSEAASTEDPMSQIAQILSSHLESLQWIDGAVREVETKISDVERRINDSNHNSLTASKSRGFGLNR